MGLRRPFHPLPALGTYYGRDWSLTRPGDGALDVVLNRTTDQATRDRMKEPLPDLKTYAAAMMTDEINGAGTEWAKFKVKDVKRGRWIEVMVKDHKIPKHTAHAFMVQPRLEGHCPRCTMVYDPMHCRFTEEECVVLRPRGPPAGFQPSDYPFCNTLPRHAKCYCQKLNLRCLKCLHRGHAVEDLVCDRKQENLNIFEEFATVGLDHGEQIKAGRGGVGTLCRHYAATGQTRGKHGRILEATQHDVS
jgi:hypothetical protein